MTWQVTEEETITFSLDATCKTHRLQQSCQRITNTSSSVRPLRASTRAGSMEEQACSSDDGDAPSPDVQPESCSHARWLPPYNPPQNAMQNPHAHAGTQHTQTKHAGCAAAVHEAHHLC